MLHLGEVHVLDVLREGEDVAVRVFDGEVAVAPELVLDLLDELGAGLLHFLEVAVDVVLAEAEIEDDADTRGRALRELGGRDVLGVLGRAEHHHQIADTSLAVHQLTVFAGQRQPFLEAKHALVIVHGSRDVVHREQR